MEPNTTLSHLEHGRVYLSRRFEDGTRMAAMAWKKEDGLAWQLLDLCAGDATCTHGRHPHLGVQADGSLVLDEGIEPSRHDLDVRAVAESLTVHDFQPADSLARTLFRSICGDHAACNRCEATRPEPHHPMCHTHDLVPLFPMFDRDHWQVELVGGLY